MASEPVQVVDQGVFCHGTPSVPDAAPDAPFNQFVNRSVATPKRPRIDFSIEAILAHSTPKHLTLSHSPPAMEPAPEPPPQYPLPQSSTITSNLTGTVVPPMHPHQLSWLHCTRYRPPKLPRVKREAASRTRYRNPRIPFSSVEVAALETKFRASPYLGSHDVVQLAASLNMSPKRIKIWFQNRRARERRESDVQ